MIMAIVHDIAEAIVGDTTPSCGVWKRRVEEKAKHLNTCANSWVEEKESLQLMKSLSFGENTKQTLHLKPELLKILISLR
uniref:HD domain-containing protein n=1 Tax=Noccaea caerulescens TaxID=107243 RepID=A0A1J3I8I5_NOCCA